MESLQNIRIPPFPVDTLVTVYTADGFDFDTGTGPLATLFAVDGTPLANPYPVAVAGEFFHLAEAGEYHVKFAKEGWNGDTAAWLFNVNHGHVHGNIAALNAVEITYSKAGSIGVSAGGVGRIIKRSGYLRRLAYRVGTPSPDGETVIEVMRNGDLLTSFTIGIGQSDEEFVYAPSSAILLANNDVLTVDCTAAATTKAKDLSITFLLDLA